MKKFNSRDFDVDVYTDTNEDGFIYGHIAEFDNFRKNSEEDILENLEIYFPWGSELQFEEYLEFINQPIFLEFPELLFKNDSFLGDMQIIYSGKNIYDITVQFPYREDSGMSEIIEEIFDICDVPKGTISEESLPLELQFWPQYNYDDDYEFYKKIPFSLENHKKNIESIYQKIDKSDDPIIIKALILSMLSSSEYTLKSLIVNKASTIKSSHDFIHDLFRESFNRKLKGTVAEHRSMFKNLYGADAPIMDWTPVRNALAHEIENTEILTDKIRYKNLSTKKMEEYNIEELFQKQRDFNKKLTEIIVSHNQ